MQPIMAVPEALDRFEVVGVPAHLYPRCSCSAHDAANRASPSLGAASSWISRWKGSTASSRRSSARSA